MSGKSGLRRLTGPGGCVPGPGSGGPCGEGDCPNVYATENGTFVVQGAIFSGFKPPDGESLVEIPEATLREAFHALGWA